MSTLTIANTMAVVMARLLRDGETVFHGVASPLPMIAILLAKRLHAPDLVYLNIPGGVDPEVAELPRSTVDSRLVRGARACITLIDIFDLSARGELDVAFLGGVQIDRRGRINMSFIGPSYDRPRVRLPGGAGSAALMPTARRVILWRTRHDPRTFVETLPFVTAAGNVCHVVTPLCIFERRDEFLAVASLHPHTTWDEVRRQTGWVVEAGPETPITPPPTAAELAALDALDPELVRLIEFN
jgi:glutaconate CoA-transferase subunit B